MTDPKIRAVLTGDIVHSRTLNENQRKSLYQELLNLSVRLQEMYPQVISYPISIFRGDGWQLVLDQPEKSLVIALLIRTYISSRFTENRLDSRVAIGIGKINFIPEENAAAGDGPAYLSSGHLLEAMTRERMAIDIDEMKNSAILSGLQSIILLTDHIVTRWSHSQAQAIYLAMQGKKQCDIGHEWKPREISQVAVSKNLKSAGWEIIKQVIDTYETLVKESLKK